MVMMLKRRLAEALLMVGSWKRADLHVAWCCSSVSLAHLTHPSLKFPVSTCHISVSAEPVSVDLPQKLQLVYVCMYVMLYSTSDIIKDFDSGLIDKYLL